MKHIFLVFLIIFLAGCETFNKKKQPVPPSVNTVQVIDALNDTKKELMQAGEANTKVAKNVETALSLAQRLEKLLEQIEQEQQNIGNK